MSGFIGQLILHVHAFMGRSYEKAKTCIIIGLRSKKDKRRCNIFKKQFEGQPSRKSVCPVTLSFSINRSCLIP